MPEHVAQEEGLGEQEQRLAAEGEDREAERRLRASWHRPRYAQGIDFPERASKAAVSKTITFSAT